VLIISASAEANRRGLALGGADYLLKPVTREALLHAIRRRLPSRPGTTVLVADDDAVFRRQVGATLATAGEIRVVEASQAGAERCAIGCRGLVTPLSKKQPATCFALLSQSSNRG